MYEKKKNRKETEETDNKKTPQVKRKNCEP